MGNLNIKQKLTSIIQKGVHFEVSQDKLLVKGELTLLDKNDKTFLSENKKEIIALIQNRQQQDMPPIVKMEKGLPKRLSFSQKSLWLLDKINNGSSHYNLCSAFSLSGKLDFNALNQTFVTILQRHESLRSYFGVDESGEPIQMVQPIGSFKVEIENLDAPTSLRENILRKKIKEENNKVFDLTQDFLLRVRLLNLDSEEYMLIVTMHHIASDGWSMGILINEFNILYNSFVNNETNPLSEPVVQYSDYANWQREWLTGNVLEQYTDYWKKQLTGLPVLHSLPTDKPRPAMQTFNGSTYRSVINKSTLKALYDLCHKEEASLFMGIHAAFSCLLARYSNEKDIVVGSPIANRELAETSNLVGFFMNLLVLRTDLSQNPNFISLLRQSKNTLENAYEFQQMPFENIVDALSVNRNLSLNPLFQVLLTLQNNEQGEFSFSNLSMKPVNFNDGNFAKYDLSLNINESQKGLNLEWEFNTDLFEESTIARMAKHFNTLLEGLLEQPEEIVFKVSMIDSQEANEVEKYLNGEAVEVDANENVNVWFKKQVTSHPERIAVIFNDESYSYREFGSRVERLSEYFVNRGVEPGDKVGLCMVRGVDLVASIFACFKIGATYIPLDPVYPEERLNQIIEDVQPKYVVTLNSLRTLYLKRLSNDRIILLDHSDDIVNLSPTRFLPKYRLGDFENRTNEINDEIDCDLSPEHVAYIMFTSGSTGKPKGIEITHGNLNNLFKSFDNSFDTSERQQWLAQTSINFDISVLELIWTISRGQSIVLQQSNPFKLLAPERLEAGKKIDFSVMFFGADKQKKRKYDLLIETAKFADEHGFTAIWTPERHFGEFGGAFPNPSVLSAALAVTTNQLEIRSGSVVLPLHDPVRVAEEWSVVDNLSNGRIGLSIASGWQPDDFVFSNTDYANRNQEMRDKIVELKKLWTGEEVVRENGINKDFSINIRPKPVQDELPIWITAGGNPKTFEYAGSIGANLLTHMLGQSLENLKNNIAVYHKALVENGFSVEDHKVTLMLHTYIDESREAAMAISEQAFKDYLESSIKLMEPLAKELGMDIKTQKEELINLAYNKFSRENTLIGSSDTCQSLLFEIQKIGVTEVACLIDFGVEEEKVLAGLKKIVETRKLYESNNDFISLLNVDNQKTELDLIDQYEITHVQMTPSQSKLTLDLFNQKRNKKLSSVEHWFVGGEALNQEVIKSLSSITNCNFYNMYGPTETTVWSSWRSINSEDINIGEPILNTQLVLLNEFEQEVPVGVIGELYIGGKGLAKGYYNNSKLTEERFKTIDNEQLGTGRFYKTGDLMRLRVDGNFDYVGRRDNQVKVNGYRVELEEIEKTITSIEGVKNCKVVPVTQNNNTTLSAYIVKDDVVHGDYQKMPEEQQAKAFQFPDGSTVYHQSDRQLSMLYKEIMEDGIYFKYGISIPENGLVLDLGSNIGTFSMDVNRRQPSATIIAFEPIPQIFSALKKNFEHHQIRGRVLNYGVSNKKENATFFYYPEMAGMSGRFADQNTIVDAVGNYMEHDKKMVKIEAGNYSNDERKLVQSFHDNRNGTEEINEYLSSLYKAEEVECQLTTVSDIIDELGIKAIDLLKLDVEKSECLVMEGIREEHWPMIRQLAVEVDGDTNLNIILNLLNQKGYEIDFDDLVISDADNINEENTYMLYAVHPEFGNDKNEEVLKQIPRQADENIVREKLRQTLPDYMNPQNLSFVPSIPLMANGKVNMVKLKEFNEEQKPIVEIPKLTNKTQLAIYQIWSEVLEKENLPYHISIFEAGGNSMKIVLLHEKMQKVFNVSFSLVELFRNPTIKQQAKLIQTVSQSKKNTATTTAKKAVNKGKLRRRVRTNKVR